MSVKPRDPGMRSESRTDTSNELDETTVNLSAMPVTDSHQCVMKNCRQLKPGETLRLVGYVSPALLRTLSETFDDLTVTELVRTAGRPETTIHRRRG